jgi:hypothetical protein
MSRLIDWQPHWVNISGAADGVEAYIGVSLLCPHCTHTPCPTCGAQRGKRIAVSFWPPIIPENQPYLDVVRKSVQGIPHEGYHERVSGETFDRLTLKPSIGFEAIGHWHGTITSGECVP